MSDTKNSTSLSSRWPVTIVATLGVAMVGLWVHILQIGPAPAIGGFLRNSSSHNSGASVEAAGSPTASELSAWLNEKKPPLNRNIFAVNFAQFPQENAANVSQLPQLPGAGDQVTKLGGVQADQTKERQTLQDHLREQAVKLHLQSTVLGTAPTAMINGLDVNEGDHIGPWRLVRIEATAVVVEQDGVIMEIGVSDR